MDPALYAPIRSLSLVPLAGVILIATALMTSTWPGPKSHALLIDLPQPSTNLIDAPRAIHRIGVRRSGMVTLDGNDTSVASLQERLRHLAATTDNYVIVFEPDGDAAYDTSVKVLKALWDIGLTADRFCFGGLEKHRHFGAGDAHRLNLTLVDPVPPPASDTAGTPHEAWYNGWCDSKLIQSPDL